MMTRWLGLWLVASALTSGCGGPGICDADLSSAEGHWTFTFTDEDGDQAVLTLDIDAEGNVEVDTGDADDSWECTVLSDDLCDLEVDCHDTANGNDSFSFTIQGE